MDTDDKERFNSNYIWFNQFFKDLQQLLETISNVLVKEFGWEIYNTSWYYEKLKYQPTIPRYYMTALGGNKIAIQIYAILDVSFLQGQPSFKKEPSLVFVIHSRSDRKLWPEDYGVKVISNKQVSQIRRSERMITGEILKGEGKGTQYAAFQVSLDAFRAGNKIDTALQTEIVDILRDLPDWAK